MDHREIIRRNFERLVEELDTRAVLDTLVSNKVINFEEYEKIGAEKTSFDKSRNLLTLLNRKTQEDFRTFVNSLPGVQAHLYEFLDREMEREQCYHDDGSVDYAKNQNLQDLEKLDNVDNNQGICCEFGPTRGDDDCFSSSPSEKDKHHYSTENPVVKRPLSIDSGSAQSESKQITKQHARATRRRSEPIRSSTISAPGSSGCQISAGFLPETHDDGINIYDNNYLGCAGYSGVDDSDSYHNISSDEDYIIDKDSDGYTLLRPNLKNSKPEPVNVDSALTDTAAYDTADRAEVRLPPPPRGPLPEVPIESPTSQVEPNIEACYNYDDNDDDRLSFRKGDKARRMKIDNGWWGVICNARKGWVPGNFWKDIPGSRSDPIDPIDVLDCEPWFVRRKMHRDECESILMKCKQEGGFIVRVSPRNHYSLSVYHKETVNHFAIMVTEGGKYNIGYHDFSYIGHVIDYYLKYTLFTDTNGEAVSLGSPIPRHNF